MRPRSGGTPCSPPTPHAFPARQQAPVAGRVPLPATGAYVARSEGFRGLSNPVGIHLNFALGLSEEVGPPQTSSPHLVLPLPRWGQFLARPEGLDHPSGLSSIHPWWNGHDENPTSGSIARSWRVEIWPAIYVLDEEGVIRYVDKRGGDLVQTVDRMLMEKKRRDAGAARGAAEELQESP